MSHVALIGDSIFDNAPYVQPGTQLKVQLEDALPEGTKLTFLALDGSVLSDIARQMKSVPDDVTHIFMSCGGNDALNFIDMLEEPATDFRGALDTLNSIRRSFLARYGETLIPIVSSGRDVTVCTIYEPKFDEEPIQRAAEAALCVFNDGITRMATEFGVKVLDLRLICDRREDFANPIEPSAEGGMKIAQAIVDVVTDNLDGRRKSLLIR